MRRALLIPIIKGEGKNLNWYGTRQTDPDNFETIQKKGVKNKGPAMILALVYIDVVLSFGGIPTARSQSAAG